MGLTKDWRVSHHVHRVAEIGLARNFECHTGEQSAGRHRSECLGGSESAPFAPSALATFLLARSRRAANAIPQHPATLSLLLFCCRAAPSHFSGFSQPRDGSKLTFRFRAKTDLSEREWNPGKRWA